MKTWFASQSAGWHAARARPWLEPITACALTSSILPCLHQPLLLFPHALRVCVVEYTGQSVSFFL